MPISSLVYLYDDHTRLVLTSPPSPFPSRSFNPLSLSFSATRPLSPSPFLSFPLSHSFSVSLLHSLRCPTRFPLSYRLPFSRLSPHVFLFFCLFPSLVTTSANEQATRLESPRVEPREPRAEVRRTPSYPYLRTRGMCCQEFSLTMDLLC